MKIKEFSTRLKNGKIALIRSAVAEDAEEHNEYRRQLSYETTFMSRYGEEVTPDIDAERIRIVATLASERDFEAVAIVDGKMVGCVGVYCGYIQIKYRHRAELGIGILNDYTGIGLGRALMEFATEQARANGFEQVELSVFAPNDRAIALYRKMGFLVMGIIHNAIKLKNNEYYDEFLMAKDFMPPKYVSAIIMTERLVLRSWRDEDAERLYQLAKDEEIGPLCGWKPHSCVEESKFVLRNILETKENYAICLEDTDEPIGCISLMLGGIHKPSLPPSEGEVGFWIGRDYWGKGYCTEAAKAIVQRSFKSLNLKRLWCNYFDGNERSHNVNQKCGFVFDHTEDEEFGQLEKVMKVHHASLTLERYRELFENK